MMNKITYALFALIILMTPNKVFACYDDIEDWTITLPDVNIYPDNIDDDDWWKNDDWDSDDWEYNDDWDDDDSEDFYSDYSKTSGTNNDEDTSESEQGSTEKAKEITRNSQKFQK